MASGPGNPSPTISTHVLDAELGGPAVGVHVILYKLGEDSRPIRLTQALTDADGRVRDLLDRPMSPGDYRLEFNLAARRASDDGENGEPSAPRNPFFRRLWVDVRVEDVSRSYHVPLLVSSFALTTYRGS